MRIPDINSEILTTLYICFDISHRIVDSLWWSNPRDYIWYN